MDLVHVLQKIQSKAAMSENAVDATSGFTSQPKRSLTLSNNDIKKDLESSFLKPSTRFGDNWLSRLQQ